MLRAAWLSLPLAAGPLAEDALSGWDAPPRVTFAVALWAAWALVLVATLAPRPVGLTALRVGAAWALPLALGATPSSSAGASGAGIAAAAAACALAMTPQVGAWAVNGPAYGDERRFPLRVPPTLLVTLVPVAVGLVAAPVAGAVSLADGRVVLGAALLVLGTPAAVFSARALHGLAERWAVLVPAGIVLRDHMTLTDPVLFPRSTIAVVSAGPLGVGADAGGGALDLRLGALGGSLAMELDRPAPVVPTGRHWRDRTRRGAVSATRLLFSPTRPGNLLTTAAARRLPVSRG